MSLVIIRLRGAAALVAVDTEGLDPQTGNFYQAGKLFPFPHASLVLTGRGAGDFLRAVFVAISTSPEAHLDWIAQAMPDILSGLFAGFRRKLKSSVLKAWGQQEVYLVGWSHSRGRMRGIAYQQDAAGKFVVTEIEGPGVIAPWDLGELGDPSWPDTHAGMIELANKQIAWTRPRFPGKPIGGRLVVADLTKDIMAIVNHDKLCGVRRAA